jgi:hypothetical protein
MAKTFITIVVIAVAVIIAYFALPSRYFTDSVFPLTENASVSAYDDTYDGGTSKMTFGQTDSSLSFSCSLGGTEEQSAWCGFVIDLRKEDEKRYRDWTFVDSMVFDLSAKGTDEILVKIWTYDPDVTDTLKARTFRLLMKEIPLTEGRQRIAIPMEHFYTPEFWFKDEHVDTTMVDRHQETVARVEFAPGWNHPRGKEFSLVVYGITAKGLSNFAFGVVLFIMLGLMIVAIGRSHSSKEHDEASQESNK